jgi:hypothetical protein
VVLVKLLCGPQFLPYLKVEEFNVEDQEANYASMMRKEEVQWPHGFKDHYPEEWVQLLEGLLHLNPSKRWGMQEVRSD